VGDSCGSSGTGETPQVQSAEEAQRTPREKASILSLQSTPMFRRAFRKGHSHRPLKQGEKSNEVSSSRCFKVSKRQGFQPFIKKSEVHYLPFKRK
jgi:hypothetical protein